jgi:hypothetical protein
MADEAKKTMSISPAVEIAELHLRMQAQVDFLTNRVLVLSQLLTDAGVEKTELALRLAEVTTLLEEAAIPLPDKARKAEAAGT